MVDTTCIPLALFYAALSLVVWYLATKGKL